MLRTMAVLLALVAAPLIGTETIPSRCGQCGGPPESRFHSPSCDDFDFNSALIEGLARGDRSTIEVLQLQYDTSETYDERQRIAAALLGRVEDDAAIWKELDAQAGIAVRFPHGLDEPAPELAVLCAERGYKPEQYWSMAYTALLYASADRRSAGLLRQALETDDPLLIHAAIAGYAGQRDETALPAIERALDRRPTDAYSLAPALAFYVSEAGDTLAMKYIPENDRKSYAELRDYAAVRQP